MKRFFLLTIVIFVMASIVFAQDINKTNQQKTAANLQLSTAEKEIIDLTKQWRNAMNTLDSETYNRLTADDAMIVVGGGLLTTKAKAIAFQKQNSGHPNAPKLIIEFNNWLARVFGDTAIVSFNLSAKGTIEGEKMEGYLSNTVVWMKRNGNWQLVAINSSPAPNPASKPD
jgi:ketosteroid isomerase-like protein